MSKTKNLLLPLMIAMGGLPKPKQKDKSIAAYEQRMQERINKSKQEKYGQARNSPAD